MKFYKFYSLIGIYICFLFSFEIQAQNLPVISTISYVLSNQELVPSFKRTFKYKDEQTLIETSEFQNTDFLRVPRWDITRKSENLFDASGRDAGNRSTFFFQGEHRGKVSAISENSSILNENDEQELSQFSYTRFDETGNIISFEANRYSYFYDDDFCLSEIMRESSLDSELNEQSWEEQSHSFFIHNKDCELISSETFVDGILNSTYHSERNVLGQITFEETLNGLADTTSIYRQVSTFEYNSRGQLIHADRISEDPGLFYQFENFYSYNRIGLEDTIITIFTWDTTVTKTLEAYEYDDVRNLIKSQTYEYDSLNNLILKFYQERKFDEFNQLVYSMSENCHTDDLCRLNESTISYRDDGQIEKRITSNVDLKNGEVIGEWSHTEDFVYNCAGQILEDLGSDNSRVISKIEYFYPLQPDCESGPEIRNIQILPNPASESISVISTFLNGQETEVSVYDNRGNRIYSTNTSNEFFFNLTTARLSTGQYILQLSRGDSALSEKLIIVN